MELIHIERDRIDEMVSLWNGLLGKEFPMRRELFFMNSLEDENLCEESSRLAVDGSGKLVGFLIAKRWQENLDLPLDRERAYIQVLVVDQDNQAKGLGSKLLDHAERSLRNLGVKRISLGADLWHYFPGLPKEYVGILPWFKGKGYQESGEVFDFYRKYDQLEERLPMPEAEGGSYEVLALEDKELFLTFLRRCFPDRWTYEALAYFKKGGTGRDFLVLKKEGEISGFCRINDVNSPFIAQNIYWAPLFKEELGGIGPLGIDEAERGRGYGIGIVEAGIRVLRNRGIDQIVIDWTNLTAFYEKLGYEKWKAYLELSKDLEEEI